VWAPGGAHELVGYARLITEARDRQTEHLRIYQRGDGLVYEAHPESQALTLFPLRAHGADSVVFENPAHDFPQRIAYQRVGSDSLIAVVSNLTGGGRPIRFAFRKAAECPPPSPESVSEARIAATFRTRYDSLMARELRSQGEFSQWLVDESEPGFTLRAWASAGFAVPTVDRDSYARNAEAFRKRTNPPVLRDRKYEVTVDRMLVRGDTAEVLTTTRASWYFTDATGTFGEAGKEHHRSTHDRRIDVWVQRGGAWRLSRAELISSEVAIDGRVTQRNGAAVQP
jgi:hypothetical protein